MNLTDSIRTLDQLGPAKPPTPEQAAKVRAMLAGQPDADVLGDMILGGA